MADDISDDDVRGQQILQTGLTAGLVMFWGAILFLSQATTVAAQEGAARTVLVLSGAHVVMALTTWSASALLPELRLRDRSQPIVARLRVAMILRSALLEGAALMGAVVCLLAVQLGVARDLPLVWLNGASSVVFLLVVAATFPTRERVERRAHELRQRDAL